MSPSPLLCVVHPSPEVRAEVRAALLAGAPPGTVSASAATPCGLPVVLAGVPVVVLLDPALTAPSAAVAAFAARPVVVSLSELRLPLGEMGIDHVLPRSRLTERSVAQLLLRLRPVTAGSGR